MALTGYPLYFWFPAPPAKDAPAPKHCTHKCVKCGMLYQHELGIACAKSNHRGCNKK